MIQIVHKNGQITLVNESQITMARLSPAVDAWPSTGHTRSGYTVENPNQRQYTPVAERHDPPIPAVKVPMLAVFFTGSEEPEKFYGDDAEVLYNMLAEAAMAEVRFG